MKPELVPLHSNAAGDAILATSAAGKARRVLRRHALLLAAGVHFGTGGSILPTPPGPSEDA